MKIQISHKERSSCQEDRGIMSQRLLMPRKPLDIKLTDYPLSRERSQQLLSLPSRRGTGVGRAHKPKNSPNTKAGAYVSIILGHFQKCLTVKNEYFVNYANFDFAVFTNAVKPSGSLIAISDNILRLISIPATFKPCISWL